MSPKKVSARRGLAVLGIAATVGAGLLVGPATGVANAGCIYQDAYRAVLCDGNSVGGYIGRDEYHGNGCGGCGDYRPAQFEAHWDFDRQRCGDDAFWVSLDWRRWGRNGMWVDDIHDSDRHLAVVDRGGPLPWVYWVAN